MLIGNVEDLAFEVENMEKVEEEMEMSNLKKEIEYLELRIIEMNREVEENIAMGCDEELINESIEHRDMLIRSLNKRMEELEMSRPELKEGMLVCVELNYSEVVGTITEVSDSDMFYLVDENGTTYKFYSDINKVKILDKALFYGMENVEVVNKEDREIFSNAYKVSLHNYDSFLYGVYANSAQDALDLVVDYLENKGDTGYFYTLDEVEEMEKDGYETEFIVAGNHCHHLESEHVWIEEMK